MVSGKPEKKKGLGKGLLSLIPENEEVTETSASATKEKEVMISVNEIEPNRDQPRKDFNEDALEELAESIKLHGVIEPLVLVKRDGYYMIVSGERRWRAAKKAGIKMVPATIRDYTDRQIQEISLIENIQREDLNPIEEAIAYQSLLKDYELTQEEVAERVSKSRSAVANALRLLKLCPEVQKMLAENLISSGHGRTLISIENAELQYSIATKIMDEQLNVRDTEKLVKKILAEGGKTNEKKKTDVSAIYKKLEETLKASIGTKVSIRAGADGKGKIEIEYYSTDDLERIAELLKRQ